MNLESMDKNVVFGALVAIMVCIVTFNKLTSSKVKEPSQVQLPKTKTGDVNGTAAPASAQPKAAPSRSRKMSLDYEAGTHTTKDPSPKAAPSRSRNMSLDYEAGTHTTVEVSTNTAAATSKKAAASRTRRLSMDYETGTHTAPPEAVASAVAEAGGSASSVKPSFGTAAEVDSVAAADTKASKKGKGDQKKMSSAAGSVKDKARKAQAVAEEIERLTQQKLDMERERQAAFTMADVKRMEEEHQQQLMQQYGQEEVWETVGSKTKKGGKKTTAAGGSGSATAATSATASAITTDSSVKEVKISELVTAPAAVAAAISTPATTTVSAAVAEPVTPSVLQYVTVPSKKLGQVIGPKGANLIALQEGFEVRVDIPKGEYAGTDTTITVSGTNADNVKKVAKAVSDLAIKGYSGLLMTSANEAAGGAAGGDAGAFNHVFMERSMQVPTRAIPDIIGKNGAHIRVLQEKTGCKVTITNNTNVVNDVSYSRLGMAGTKVQIAQVKQIVADILQFHHSSVLSPETIHKELDETLVPEDMYSVLIGSKGSEIKHIQGNFRVSLYIPHDDSQNQHVVLVGTPENVEAAERYIYKQVAAVQSRIADRNLRGFQQDVDPNAILEREAREQEEELAREPWMQQYVKTSGSADITQNDFSAILTKKLKEKS